MRVLGCIFAVAAFGQELKLPAFVDFPVREIFKGRPAAPILATAEQRNYQTRIRRGVEFGEDVWERPRRDPLRPRPGPNFAGQYIAILWGCGSQCVMLATVDAKTGHILEPPLARPGSLYVPLDNVTGDMAIDFRPNSSMMVLRNACKVFRAECGTYYFNLKNGQWDLLRFVKAVDPQ